VTNITENEFWNTLNESEPKITILSLGSKIYRWYNQKGELHRENDLPAEIYYKKDGSIYRKLWHQNGELHRINGPAVIFYNTSNDSNYIEYFYLYGVWYTYKEYNMIMFKQKLI